MDKNIYYKMKIKVHHTQKHNTFCNSHFIQQKYVCTNISTNICTNLNILLLHKHFT